MNELCTEKRRLLMERSDLEFRISDPRNRYREDFQDERDELKIRLTIVQSRLRRINHQLNQLSENR